MHKYIYNKKFQVNSSLLKINKFIDDNNLEKGIVLINEKNDEKYNLRQIKFINNDMTLNKKVNNITEIQNYLFHSSNEININLIDNDLIHVYFNIITSEIDITENHKNEKDINNLKLIIVNFDIYNINYCDILNIKKSLSIYFTFKNIKENKFSIKNIKTILDFILKNYIITDLIHVSYDDFIKKINDLVDAN